MKKLVMPVAGMLAALAVAGPAAADPADVTLHCASKEFTTGPPPLWGHITVINANGDVVVDNFVPGPCSSGEFR